jgi:hypothetical protein
MTVGRERDAKAELRRVCFGASMGRLLTNVKHRIDCN